MCDLLTTTLDEGYDSTTYNINRRSPLNDLAYYHVCDYGLPPDIMHDYIRRIPSIYIEINAKSLHNYSETFQYGCTEQGYH